MKRNIIFLTLLCVMLVMFCGSVSAADVPSANFTSNVTNGTAPLNVQFNDTSTGNATSWSWDFGDGINSTDENPVHKYTKAGTYSVSLTAGNDAGNNTITQTNYITVLLNDAYVSPTGNDITGDGTTTSPYATIQKALNNLVKGGTIHLASGTYTGTGNKAITFTKSVTVVGEDQTSTIIDATKSGNIFTINSGVTVTVANLTFANGNSTTYGGAIYNSGNTTVSNCTFTGNTAMGSGGIGGGAIYNKGTLNVRNSTFNSNKMSTTTNTYAGAIFGDTGTTTSVSNCTFTGNTAVNGGAIWSRGVLNVTGSTFTNNTAAGSNSRGGAIFVTAGGVANVHYNSFVNNTAATSGSAIFLGSGTVNAEYNWWGSNNSPSSQVYGNVDYSNWLYMTMTMDTTNIVNGSTVTVIANFNNIYNGTTVTSIDPANGTIPDGTVVTFSGDLGTFSPVTVTTINGTAITTFTATTVGNGTINAMAGNQTLSSDVIVRLGTNIVAGNVTVLNGNTVDLTATLTDGNGIGLSGETVTFLVNGTSYNVTTDGNGVATLSYTTSKAGIYSVTASFVGDSIYHDSSNNGTNYLIVQLNDVYVSPTGNDTIGGGTVSNPFKTLQYSLRCVVDGGKLHVLAGNYTGTGNSGLTISSNVTIVGDGQTSTIITATSSGSMFTITMDEYGFRRATLTGTIPGNVFTINPGITASISNLTLKNGSAVQGGAIYNNGNLSIANCTLTGNSVYQSDIYATYQYTYLYTFYRGGAIYNTGILSIAGCTFTDNCASSNGGAIYNNGTVVSLSNCTFTNNTAVRGDGGAIYNTGTVVSVSNCTFTNNTAGEGGAICNGPVTNGFGIYSTLNATNCTFTGNTAAGWGGAILNGDAATLNLSKCSFTNNTATTGGSIYSWGPLTVNACTFMNNTADSSAAIFNRKNATLTGCTFLNNKSTRYSGGAVCNSGNMNITGCVFENNSAVAGGAIENSPDGTIGVLSNCTFINNTATLNATYAGGGAIDNGGILPSLIGCVFVNNTATQGSSIYDDSAFNSMNAEYNWWGSNSDPSSQIYVSSGTIDYSNWLYMTETINPTTILNGTTATVTVSFNNIWNGTNVVSIDPVTVHIPDGTMVTFTSDLGTFSPVTVTITKGTAATIFTATTLGNGTVNVTTGNQTVSSNVMVYDVPVAGFTANVTSGLDPLSVQFTDISSNSPTSWAWDFNNDGVIDSTDENPTWTYNAPGTYTVVLTVGNLAGNDTVTETDYITVYNSTVPVVSAYPVGGLYNVSQNVTLSVDLTGSTIYYTTDGSDPTDTGNTKRVIYTSPVEISNTTVLNFAAVNAGGVWSSKYSQTYTIDTTSPIVTANTATGTYNSTQSVTLVATDDTNTTIYYKTDGSDPTTSSPVYTGPITVTNTTMLKYIAVDAAGNWSPIYTQNYTIDTTVPTVKVVDPANSAVNVAVNKVIKVTFNEAIKAGNGSIELVTSNGTVVPSTWSISGNVLSVTSNSTLAHGVKYMVLIHTGSVTDLAGNNVAGYVSRFTTSSDAAVPVVKTVDPTNNAVNVAANKVIKVTFSEAITKGTGWIELVTSKGTVVPSTWSVSGNVLTIKANSTLTHGVNYMVLIHTGCVTDLAGNSVKGYVSRFTVDTVAPTVKTVDPANNAVNVAANKVIKVTFSESIRAGNGSIELVTSNGTVVPSTWSISGNVLSVTSNSTLAHGVKYMVLIHTGSVTDLAGNSVKGYVSRFTVDTVAPAVKTVDPVNNAVKVATSKVIKVTFSEAIKAGTGWIELVSSNGTSVSVKCSVSGSVLTITPISALSKNVKYTVLIHTGSVTDLAGNSVKGYVTRFTTTA